MGKRVKRRVSFIETDDGRLFLPRPTSVFTGQARHIWFEKLTGACPSIASPDYWNLLLEKGGCLKRLVEYDDDTWKINKEIIGSEN
tara:strand:- start:88 stop:345 length:258 start_codon:yes stop_codon:yes gene_type:complete